MTAVVVQRGIVTRIGNDIVDPLMSDNTLALERGRKELDDNGQEVRSESLQIVYRSGLVPGLLVEVQDQYRGVNWKGKIDRVSISKSGPRLNCVISVRRPLI